MRHPLALATTIVLLACDPAAPPGDSSERNASPDSTVDRLLASAATDFRSQRAPHPVRFRGVRSGYVVTSQGVRQYRLCGEYSPANQGEADWIAFATIKTSPYEQWLGGQALDFCKDAGMTWDKEDLSSRLLSRFNSESTTKLRDTAHD